ncbi:hypothetical protein CPB86DRAFT_694090 [Serendipita vermifera]|nr:hypothetical protein CPB86DRAFT_694090 [Serendipita vermifera]
MVAFSLALVAALLSAAPMALSQEISQCISDCTNQSLAAGGCTSQQDINCVCTSSAFQAAAASCLFANCPDQLGNAMQLQSQMCSGGGTCSPHTPVVHSH